jgi:hypothetical protein
MTLPVLAKTWQFNINQTIGLGTILLNRAALLFAIKSSMTGFASNPWTVAYSCDSSTAGTAGDGVDHWTTAANVVFGTSTAAHSWIVLKQTGIASNFQVLISASPEAGSISSSSYVISIYISPSAGFTGGSTTTRPTATDEVTMLTCGINGGPGFGGTTPGTAATRVQALQSTDGACTRFFLCKAGIVWGVLLFETVSPTINGTWSPAWYCRVNKSSASSFPVQNAAADFYSLGGAININSTPATAGLTAEGLGTLFGPIDTTFGNLANDVDGAWPMWPMGLVSATASARGRHGTMIDLWYGSAAVTDGDTYDATSKQFAQFAGLIVPWDGSTTPALT